MIPKFNIYHTNLHGSFIKFDKYVQFLKDDYFNGYIFLDDHKNKLYLFLLEGEIQNCLRQTNAHFEKLNFMQAMDTVKDQSSISTYRCSAEQVDFFSKLHTMKALHQDLSSDIVNPDKLIKKCKAEKFNGIVEINSGQDRFYLYFLQGVLLGSMSQAKDNFFDQDTKENTLLQQIAGQSTINIFKISLQDQDSPDNRARMIECFEKIFNALEKKAKGQDFNQCWRECALELGERYTFLDPFAEEFNYLNGQLDVWEKINSKTLARGLDELVHKISSRLKCPAETITDIKREYSKELADYEIGT
ncbi:MAG: hypothetical protein ACLFSY_04830 [Desulfonatronovibrionaceae bacterium]